MNSESRQAIDTVLDTLFERDPPPLVAAFAETGLFVSMPLAVPVREGRLIEGRTSAMQLVIPADIPAVVETFSRVLREGVASSRVRLLGDDAQVELWFIDSRHIYGVLLCFIAEPVHVPDEAAAILPGVWRSIKNEIGAFTDVQPAVVEILGWTPQELIGRRSLEFIHADDLVRATTSWMKMLAAPGAKVRSRLRHLHRNGSWIWVETVNHNRLAEPGYGCIEAEMVELSEMAATIDPITGCLNRLSILAELNRRIHLRLPQSGAAVILFYLDGLKRISDYSGHSGAEDVLRVTSERLLTNARSDDVIGRLSDDQFLLICEVNDEEEAAAVAERIGPALREIVESDALRIEPTVNIGVAWTNGDTNADGLVAAAEAAIHSKAGHHYRNEVFRASLRKQTTRKLRLQTDLRHAIKREELSVWYQPIVELGMRRITGFEALFRWHHRDLGAISPLEAIPIAEDSGLIIELGNWVLREACARARNWQSYLPIGAGLSINVNVSPLQFREAGFIESVDSALSDSGLRPACLHIEITETLLADDLAAFKAIFGRIRDRGIEVHIDDFGTGYSSLAYLDKLPVDVLKIDKSFVSGTADGLANPQIVETVIKLARELGLTVTAEGIETAEQEQALRKLRCARGQGFLYSRALAADLVPKFLTQWQAQIGTESPTPARGRVERRAKRIDSEPVHGLT